MADLVFLVRALTHESECQSLSGLNADGGSGACAERPRGKTLQRDQKSIRAAHPERARRDKSPGVPNRLRAVEPDADKIRHGAIGRWC